MLEPVRCMKNLVLKQKIITRYFILREILQCNRNGFGSQLNNPFNQKSIQPSARASRLEIIRSVGRLASLYARGSSVHPAIIGTFFFFP